VAGVADHEGLAPFPCHDGLPRGLVWAGGFELSESADLVDLHLPRFAGIARTYLCGAGR
jgi:hypothetical protein